MVRDPNMLSLDRGPHTGCAALAMAAESVLAQCESLILHVGDAAYTSTSRIIRGGTLGKHLRHTLDHFGAVLRAVGESGEVVSYDDRERDVPMETSRGAAFLAGLVTDSSFSAQLLEAGLADGATLETLGQGFLQWGTNSDAFAAEAWGEAVAWQP